MQKIKTVYRFKNLINGKEYYGSTVNNPEIRYKQHMYHATHPADSKYNYPLYCAIRKYGIENFTFDIIEQKECSEEEIRFIEQQYIIMNNTIAPNGYNQTSDTIHPPHSDIIDQKVSETKREKAKEVIEIDINNNILQRWRSIIDCAENTGLDQKKIAAVCRGERKTTSNRIFRWLNKDTDEIEIPQYSRDPYKGKEGTTQIQSSSKKVAKIDLKTNQIIKIYDTIALAARENNCDPSAISKVCRKVRNKCGNFGWKFIDDEKGE